MENGGSGGGGVDAAAWELLSAGLESGARTPAVLAEVRGMVVAAAGVPEGGQVHVRFPAGMRRDHAKPGSVVTAEEVAQILEKSEKGELGMWAKALQGARLLVVAVEVDGKEQAKALLRRLDGPCALRMPRGDLVPVEKAGIWGPCPTGQLGEFMNCSKQGESGAEPMTIETPTGPLGVLELFLGGCGAGGDALNRNHIFGTNGSSQAWPIRLEAVALCWASEPVATAVQRVWSELRRLVSERVEAPGGEESWRDLTYWPFPQRGIPITVSRSSRKGPLHHGMCEGWEDHLRGPSAQAYTALGLEAGFPVLHERCSLLGKHSQRRRDVLLSPHLAPGLRAHGLPAARTREARVAGDLWFFHYMQDDVDDRGWGCAYRALQIAASWFVLNGWSRAPPPRIAKAQQVLAEMGVMDAAFSVGCQQWVGSQEVAWVLSSVYGVESRFLFCRGQEIPTLARDLEEHFSTTGSPVVCCGNSLALSIAGVAWDPVSGQAKFLILDPHYTGADTLDSVLGKSTTLEGGFKAPAVAWRAPANAFSPTASYTLVLPQRPNASCSSAP